MNTVNILSTETDKLVTERHGPHCPECGSSSRVIDARPVKDSSYRRRRECLLNPAHRFTTYERIERRPPRWAEKYEWTGVA